MRTLADMTPQERAECVGMWGQHRTLGLVIISTTDGIQSRGINVEIVRFLHDDRPIITWEPTNSIIPRDDLPRAWQADGQPPAGEWEYRPEQLETWGEWKPIAVTTNKDEAESWTTTKQFKDATTRVMKRRIGQWEEA